jgi:hypothetical protein
LKQWSPLTVTTWLSTWLSTWLAAWLAVLVAATWRWPLVGDAPLFHYILLLGAHGMVPYRDIADLNLPGTYAVEWLVMHTLGPGPLAWRLWDFSLLLCVGLGMAGMCPREQRWR